MSKEIKDYLDRGVQLSVEDGFLTITHAEGKLRLYRDDMGLLVFESGQLLERVHPRPTKPEVEIDPLNPDPPPVEKKVVPPPNPPPQSRPTPRMSTAPRTPPRKSKR